MQSLDEFVLFLFKFGDFGFNLHALTILLQNTINESVTSIKSAFLLLLNIVSKSLKLTMAFLYSASSFCLLIISLILLFLAASASLCLVIIIAFLADSSFNLYASAAYFMAAS